MVPGSRARGLLNVRKDFRAGQFQVLSTVSGEKWTLALDMEAADIMLLDQ